MLNQFTARDNKSGRPSVTHLGTNFHLLISLVQANNLILHELYVFVYQISKVSQILYNFFKSCTIFIFSFQATK